MKKRIVIGVLALIILIAFIYSALVRKDFTIDGENKVLYQGKYITDIYTDSVRYNPGEKAVVTLEFNNTTHKDFSGTVYLYLKHLGKTQTVKEENIDIKIGEKLSLEVLINLPQTDFKGYLIESYLTSEKKIYDNKNSAINVSSTWEKFPIYGYITDFPEQNGDKTRGIIEELNKYHINVLQFYDWQDKHHQPLPSDGSQKWKDIAGREITLSTVKDYINYAHEKNIMAANYNLIYGAYSDYVKDGVEEEWGLFKDSGHKIQDGHNLPSSWESSLRVFNPLNRGWQSYIFTEEEKVNRLLNFDIWHMDTLGNRGYIFDYSGNVVDLKSTYSSFVKEATKSAAKQVVFNTVNSYGLEEIAKSDVSILYSELWPSDFYSYMSLKQVIDKGNKLTDGKKKTVLAAYMNYEKANSKGEFNENSVRLCDAAIFAAGGSHIELGDTGMLGKEYFPNKNLDMSYSLKNAMRSYYDFLVAYENLLRDGLKEANNKIEIKGIEVSNKGQAGKVWAYSRGNEKYDVIQLINLLDEKSQAWRDDFGKMPPPGFKKDLKLKYYTNDTDISNVFLASPDIKGGKAESLEYKIKEDGNGKFLEIKVPELMYWDMIYVER